MYLNTTFIIYLIYICISISKINAVKYESALVNDGYPSGYLSDCPGSAKEAKIANSSLKYLSFVLLSEGFFLSAKRTNFNYFHMKQLSKQLDFKKKTILYMTGYMDSALHYQFAAMMGSVYSRLGYNVLLLEYVWFSAMFYPRAVRFLRPIGQRSAEMLASLTNYGLDPANMEIAGISLGGHGIGFIAKHFQLITGRNISKLTGLDPSGPCFRHVTAKDRIDASDADFVEILHTNIDNYGLATPIGHVDYYINGGEFQIGDVPEVPCSGLCSHARAYTVWVSALLHPNHFKAIQCKTVQDARERNCYDEKPLVTNLLGPNVDRNKAGIFYLATNYYYPYYMGDDGTKRENDPYVVYMDLVNKEDVIIV